MRIVKSPITALEEFLLGFVQTEIPLEHFFIPGIYVRVMRIEAGTILTGAVHNYPCISIIAKGLINVSNGDEEQLLKAGDVLLTQPGLKRAGFAREDTTFITVHRTDKIDISEVEKELVSRDYETYLNRLENIT